LNYSYLSIWCAQNRELQFQIEAVYRSAQELSLCCKDGRELRFVLRSREAFPLLLPAYRKQGESIWNQLRHASLSKLSIDEGDRIIYLDLSLTDIYQQAKVFRLIAELSPPRPNLILCELADSRAIVVDALHKYSLADNPARQILPRLEYQPAHTGWKPDPAIPSAPFELKLPESEELLQFEQMNAYFEALYTGVLIAGEARDRIRRQKAQWQKAIDKLQKKLDKQRQELQNAEALDTWKLYAEVIKYSLSNIHKGQSSLEAVNYYDPSMPNLSIPLRADLSPTKNLELYLKRYSKAKTGLEVIARHIAEGETELRLLQDAMARVEAGEDLDFSSGQGKSAKSGISKLSMLDKLLRIKVSDEFEIAIGRKASENDFVSTQLGRPHDWWFHTRIYRGAHVLLRCLRKTEPSPELKTMCCRLAAWFSKARSSSNVPVDYTQVRYLRKPRRSAPGFITYTDHQTAFVEPLEPRKAREELGL